MEIYGNIAEVNKIIVLQISTNLNLNQNSKIIPEIKVLINAKVALPLNDWSNFWRTIEMPLIICEINLIVTYSERFVISEGVDKTLLQ